MGCFTGCFTGGTPAGKGRKGASSEADGRSREGIQEMRSWIVFRTFCISAGSAHSRPPIMIDADSASAIARNADGAT